MFDMTTSQELLKPMCKSGTGSVQNNEGRILCVDDDPDSRELMKTLFRLEGYQVIATGTVEEGMWQAISDKFDLILLDWVLADGTGIELCTELRRIGVPSPILFYSGIQDRDEIAGAMRAGAQGFLIKATNFEQVLQNVSRFLSNGVQDRPN